MSLNTGLIQMSVWFNGVRRTWVWVCRGRIVMTAVAEKWGAEEAGGGVQGVGLVWPTNFGNVEVNYSQVLSAKDMDRAKPGLQLGFNISPF